MKKIKLKLPGVKEKFFKKKIKRVVSLINDNMYIYENNTVFKEEVHRIKGIVTSTVSFKDVVNISFKLSKALTEEEIPVEAEKYVYDQNILDLTKEYEIVYNFQKYEEFYYVDAFAVESEKLEKLMGKYLETFKYIDFVSFAPFAFSSFYSVSNVTPLVDVFIYFNKDDAYIVGFKSGKFVFIRSLDKFSVLEKELNKSAEEIIEILKIKGVYKNKYDDEYTFEIIDTFFSKFFMKINNIMNYSINFFKLDKINRVYFYSPFKINGLIEQYSEFLNLSDVQLKHYLFDNDYDPFEYSVTLYNAKYFDNEDLNFSVFKRPLPLYKRESGKLFLFTLFLTSVIGLDAAYKKYELSKIQTEKFLLQMRASNYQGRLDRIKKDIKNYDAKIKSSQKEMNGLLKRSDIVYKKIEKLYKYNNKSLFTNEYVKIVSLLEKYGLKLSHFKKAKNSFSIVILSSEAMYDNIPLFLNDLKNIGFTNVKVHSIENNSTSYRTKVMFDE